MISAVSRNQKDNTTFSWFKRNFLNFFNQLSPSYSKFYIWWYRSLQSANWDDKVSFFLRLVNVVLLFFLIARCTIMNLYSRKQRSGSKLIGTNLQFIHHRGNKFFFLSNNSSFQKPLRVFLVYIKSAYMTIPLLSSQW